MSVATLANPPTDGVGWREFALQHMAEHQSLNARIFAQANVFISSRPIDPIPVNYSDWLLEHQALHDEANSALGTIGLDYREVDFSDPEDLQSWFNNHYNEHLTLNGLVGL